MRKTTFELKNEFKDFCEQLEKKSTEILEAATNNEADKIPKIEEEIRSLEKCISVIHIL